MVIKRFLTRLAEGAAVPVFAVTGNGRRDAVQDLQLEDTLRFVDSPREAAVLLVVGPIPSNLARPLQQLHDAMPHPRCTVWSIPDALRGGATEILPDALFVDEEETIVAAVLRAHRQVLRRDRPSERSLLPDTDPLPWRGVGPYGQGGAGMTGGTPYGRPMAELADDRDQLRLDVLPLRIGPFFPRFPSGLILDVELAGDVIVKAAIERSAFAPGERAIADLERPLDPFSRALSGPVPIVELELARARSHLRWLATALAAYGLRALGDRALRFAQQVQPGDAAEVHRLARLIEWTQVLRWSTAGVGQIDRPLLAGLGVGPVGRASGLVEDTRLDDPAYRALGFQPMVHEHGDAAARWRQRLAEAAQSLDLASRAGGRSTELRGRVESPRGRLEPDSAPMQRLLPLVPGWLMDCEWGDAVTLVGSLDLDHDDLEEIAATEPLSEGMPA